METISINDIEHVNRNLWRKDGKYYRLFAYGVTPNGCWLIAPIMRELLDIGVASGTDVLGDDTLVFDGVTGTVPAHYEFIKETPAA